MAETIEQMNEFIKAYAEKKGITPTEALLEFKKNFLHRSEVVEMMQKKAQPPRVIDLSSPAGSCERDETNVIFSEQAKVEMKRLELEQKRIDADQKRLDLEMRKQELAEKKLDMDERLRREEIKVDRDRAATERLILLANSSGKKPDEMMEVYKEQNKSTREFYDKALQLKDSERDREMAWKKELAQIEADRDVELAKIKEEADAETASQMDTLVEKMDEKFGLKVGDLKATSSADDFVSKMKEYKKMQDEFLGLTFDTLEARGFDKDQLAVMKKAAKIEEKKQEGTVDKLWELGKKIWKDYVEPEVDKAKKELEQPPALTASQTEEQRRAEEARVRKEVEEAERLAEQNAVLKQQLENEKKGLALQRQRQGLEARAAELGMTFDPALTDQRLYDLIVEQEQLIDQVHQERQKLEDKAREIGLAFDPSMTNKELFDAIEKHEAISERERQIDKNNEALRDKGLHGQEGIIEESGVEVPGAKAGDEIDEKPEELKPRPHGLKKKQKKEATKRVKKFLVTKDDGTLLGNFEAVSAYGAALKLPVIGGTDPVKIKVQEEGSDKTVDYEVYTDGKNRQKVRKP